MSVIVRNAIPADAEQITFVHLESWKTTYRGIFPDEWLDKSPETIAKNVVNRRMRITQEAESNWQEIVAEVDGKIVGLASGGVNRNPEFPYQADLCAIYLLKEYQNQGIGRLLVRAFAELVIKNGMQSMIIWALEENHKARRFYEKLGGKPAGTTLYKDKYPEVGFGFNDVNKLKM